VPIRTEILPSFYRDSVVLMRVAAQVKKEHRVREVAAFMGTETNKALLVQTGLATPESAVATPEDLILTVDSDTDEQAASALERVTDLLAERREADGTDAEVAPHTLDSALRLLPDANLATISVPGEFVRFEALRALRRGLNVFVFSDNVPIADEIELKKEGLSRGLLCMGPDCGTAYVNGAGLGFFNVTTQGRVGCVAASGTGLQAVVSRLAHLGEGISHGIGVGGRDLSAEVGGMMTLFALAGLAADPGTEAIVLISKPPHKEVVPRLSETLEKIDKPVVVCCLGSDDNLGGRTVNARTLDEAADAVAAQLRGETWAPAAFGDPASAATGLDTSDGDGELAGAAALGLYTGGTLAHEAHLLLTEALGDVGFNGDPTDRSRKHRIIDLGDDAYTVGRPHPMIAPEIRTDLIRWLLVDPTVGVLILDLVLGVGAHGDPAAPVVEALGDVQAAYAAAGRRLVVVTSVVGTPGDPQDLSHQIRQLTEAGVKVFPTNAEAVRFAAMVTDPKLSRELTGSGR
jgi:FdrA protein